MMFFQLAKAQQADTSYLDIDWAGTTRDKAAYYTVCKNNSENHVECNTYWSNSNILKTKAVYSDTAMNKLTGLQLSYYKNGLLEDSSMYNDDGVKTEGYHYYPNKQMAARYVAAMNGGKGILEGYDESGQKMKNFIYEREAEFKGGEKAWNAYLSKNLNGEFRNTKSDEELKVTVIIQFFLDGNGFVKKPKVIQSSGIPYIDKDALNVIAASPQWNNAVQFNNPVRAYRRQPITYTLAPAKSKK